MNKIICNDALTSLKDIDDKSVDIVLTSPPYNFDMQYDEHDDKSDSLKYINCLLYTSPNQRDRTRSRMPSSA